MVSRFAVCLWAAMISLPVGASDMGRAKQMEFARGFGRLVANGGPDRGADKGLLVLQVDWIDKRWMGREAPPADFTVEFSPTNGGAIATADMAQGKAGIAELRCGGWGRIPLLATETSA